MENTMRTETIDGLLEEVIAKDEISKPLSRNPMKAFRLSKTIYHNKISLNDITRWQYDISKHIYLIYVRGLGCSANIDLTQVMVDANKEIITDSIISKIWETDNCSHVRLVNTIINVHKSMLGYVNDKHFNATERCLYSALELFGNYFYSAAALNANGTQGLSQTVILTRHLHTMTELGMFDDLKKTLTK